MLPPARPPNTPTPPSRPLGSGGAGRPRLLPSPPRTAACSGWPGVGSPGGWQGRGRGGSWGLREPLGEPLGLRAPVPTPPLPSGPPCRPLLPGRWAQGACWGRLVLQPPLCGSLGVSEAERRVPPTEIAVHGISAEPRVQRGRLPVSHVQTARLGGGGESQASGSSALRGSRAPPGPHSCSPPAVILPWAGSARPHTWAPLRCARGMWRRCPSGAAPGAAGRRVPVTQPAAARPWVTAPSPPRARASTVMDGPASGLRAHGHAAQAAPHAGGAFRSELDAAAQGPGAFRRGHRGA